MEEVPHSTGTTLVALTYDGGVVLCADSLTTAGSFVANRASNKIAPICDNIYIMRSGTVAHTQAITAYIQYYIAHHQAELNEQPTVRAAASIARQLVYPNKDRISGGFILAGYDEAEGGTVQAISLGGTLLKVPFAIAGSGGTYLTGFLDRHFKDGLSHAAARDVAIRAVSLAMGRDGSSGGCIRVVSLSKEGSTRELIRPPDVPKWYGEL